MRNGFLIVGAVMLAAFFAVIHLDAFHIAVQNDFLSLYTGASLAFDAGLHDPARQLGREQEILPDPARQLIPFVRPVFYAWVLSPLARLSYHNAFIVWLGLQYGILAWIGMLAWLRFGPPALILCAVYWPLEVGIFAGQDSLFILLLVFYAFLAVERGQPVRAGVLCGLTLFKFHLLLLLPFVLLYRRNWRMLGGYSITAGVLAAACVLSGQALPYVALLRRKDFERLSPSPDMMTNLESIGLNFSATWLYVPLFALVLGLVLCTSRRHAPWAWLGGAVGGSLLLPPHSYLYDLTALLVFLLAALTEGKVSVTRWLTFLFLLPPIHGMIVLGHPWAAGPALMILVLLGSWGIVEKDHSLPLIPFGSKEAQAR
jgi:Glycosyltransferase family 87